MKSYSSKKPDTAATVRILQRGFIIFWMLVSPAYLYGATHERPGNAKEFETRYFASPRDAVNRINVLLRSADWKTLSEYYDLSGSSVDRKELESGQFFIRTERPEKADPGGFWRYRHPFPPGFVFHHEQSTDDPSLVIVVVGTEIDQGGRMKQRVLTEFKMRKSANGYQILPP